MLRRQSSVLLAVHLAVVAATAHASSLSLTFSAEAGGLRDGQGRSLGFTTRLANTGQSLSANDDRLSLNTSSGMLSIATTDNVEHFNGQEGLDVTEAIGVRLSDLGFTGSDDFEVTAVFAPLPSVDVGDQAGVFVGTSSEALTRAAHNTVASPEYFAANTAGMYDYDGHFFGAGFNGADGMTVTIRRTAGTWVYLIDGTSWAPNENADGTGQSVFPTFLDGASDLTVGVFAINGYDGAATTYLLDRFDVRVEASSPDVADFNGDGAVDGDDLIVLTQNFGLAAASQPLGDSDGDLDVDGGDVLVWQRRLAIAGAPVASNPVPEPDFEAIAPLLALVLPSALQRVVRGRS